MPAQVALHALSNPLIAGATSFASTIGLAAGALPVPEGVPNWLPYAVSVMGPILMALGMRVLGGIAARKRALAESKARRAAALKADKDPANDAEAAKLEDEAAALKADADALDAARKP